MSTTTRKTHGTTQWTNVTEAYRNGQRESIAHTAMTLLIEGGGSGLSMSGLAQAAGISRPTLYRYYPDMESVLVGVAELVAQHDEAFAAEVLAEADPRDQLRAFLDAVTDPIAHGHPSAIELEAALPPEGRKLLHAHEDRGRELLVGILKRGVQAGYFAADVNPDTDALFILGLTQQAQADTIERVHVLVDKLIQPTRRRKS
jgi:AcrR family transcriptional regulator